MPRYGTRKKRRMVEPDGIEPTTSCMPFTFFMISGAICGCLKLTNKLIYLTFL